jgi:hypothetical protein
MANEPIHYRYVLPSRVRRTHRHDLLEENTVTLKQVTAGAIINNSLTVTAT